MDNISNKFDSKNKILKITFLDIYPPINELSKPKEDFNIIFQGNDNFFDFKKHLISKMPINLSCNKKSLIMTLLKNNNIFATGFFTIRQGEQTIVFNHENNKKIISNKTVNINNLSECIKIKIYCECENISTISTINRNTINTNYENDNNNSNKYVTKVNLMKPIRISNYKNKFGKKIYDKKKRILNRIHQTTNNSMKKNLVNDSQELGGGNYTAFLTEEITNFRQNFNTNNNSEMKKYNKIISNTARKNDSINNKGTKRITKTKSKNFLSTNKKQNKNFGNHIKMNNSSINLINQSNKVSSSDNCQNNAQNSIIIRNYYTNRNSLKSNTSYNKMTKRNSNNSNLNNKNTKSSLNNYVSGNIIEHVNSNEKINYISINKNIERNNNKDIKKIKNNNNITMNSVSTTVTKKNELEFSMNSFQDYDDKNIMNSNMSNKNTLKSFTNRTSNERMTQKLSENKNSIIDNINKNTGKHKFNKSLCEQSLTEKIFNENNDINFNFGEKNEKYYNLCRSANKLVINYNDINDINNNILINEDKKISNNDYNEEENDLLDNNFTKLKEDFNLLYNLEYISKINEDLFKLELELFIEKMSELFSAYHTQMDKKILEHEIINREYKTNFGNYLLYNKLKDKLAFIKKKINKEKNNFNERKQYNENVKTNINEINIFKIIFPNLINKEDKINKLKKILSIILKNKENRELIGEKHDIIKEFS